MAASRKSIECSTWRPRSKLTSEVQLHLCGSFFTVDKELLALKSSKISKLFKSNPQEDPSRFLRDIPGDQESIELVAKFCHGFEINLTTDNVVRVACVAHYLGMTDTHCPDNLLTRAVSFVDENIIPSWNNCIKALKRSENVRQHALDLGLVDYCMESLVAKALDDPRLLGEPFRVLNLDEDDSDCDDGDDRALRHNVRRKLFDLEWKCEDLTTLSLRLYAPIIQTMVRRQVPYEYIAANLCLYAKTWLFSDEREDVPVHKKNSQREILEVVEHLLPHQRGFVSCTFLFEMLRLARALDAASECIDSLEIRIGKQLDQASVKDLLIPCQGYSKHEQYDTESVRRIFKHFYCNYVGPDQTGLNSVSELIDEFLAEISLDIDLKPSTFITVADMSRAASSGTQRNSDGIYRAIDVYLDKHRHLTESERDELCQVLDFDKMSSEACEHAAQNSKLPLRTVVQVLFVVQLKLREALANDVQLLRIEADEEDGTMRRTSCNDEEIKKMGSKVMELERECGEMRREMRRVNNNYNIDNPNIHNNGASADGNNSSKKQKKTSLWKEMKRKLGCSSSSMNDYNCHVKKKKINEKQQK